MSNDLTITEKIFSRASGRPVRAGDFVMASVDRAMTHDITGPLAVEGFYEIMRDERKKTCGTPIRSSSYSTTRSRPTRSAPLRTTFY